MRRAWLLVVLLAGTAHAQTTRPTTMPILAQGFRVAVEVLSLRQKVALLEKRIGELEAECQALRAKLAGVTAIRSVEQSMGALHREYDRFKDQTEVSSDPQEMKAIGDKDGDDYYLSFRVVYDGKQQKQPLLVVGMTVVHVGKRPAYTRAGDGIEGIFLVDGKPVQIQFISYRPHFGVPALETLVFVVKPSAAQAIGSAKKVELRIGTVEFEVPVASRRALNRLVSETLDEVPLSE